jgi:hypothetical protein
MDSEMDNYRPAIGERCIIDHFPDLVVACILSEAKGISIDAKGAAAWIYSAHATVEHANERLPCSKPAGPRRSGCEEGPDTRKEWDCQWTRTRQFRQRRRKVNPIMMSDRPDNSARSPISIDPQPQNLLAEMAGEIQICSIMVTDKIKELAEIEARALELRKAIAQERAKELAGLPEQYGYAGMKEFIAALKAVGSDAKKSAPKGRKKRVKITPELKEAIVKALREGKTAPAIADEQGVSPASVNSIKKDAGLVKARKQS